MDTSGGATVISIFSLPLLSIPSWILQADGNGVYELAKNPLNSFMDTSGVPPQRDQGATPLNSFMDTSQDTCQALIVRSPLSIPSWILPGDSCRFRPGQGTLSIPSWILLDYETDGGGFRTFYSQFLHGYFAREA